MQPADPFYQTDRSALVKTHTPLYDLTFLSLSSSLRPLIRLTLLDQTFLQSSKDPTLLLTT